MALRLAVLLSGSGTTLQNILDCCDRGELDARVACVVSSRPDAYGLERARKAGVPAITVNRKEYSSVDAFGEAVWDAVMPHNVDLVVLAGFMSLLTIPKQFEGRIMNVHPALIPAFSGEGMYGKRVHQAVLDKGAKITGVTVHFVDEHYDHGPIILQAPVAVHEDDTAETLAERVQAKEREVYPKAIQLFAENRLRIEEGRVRVLDASTPARELRQA